MKAPSIYLLTKHPNPKGFFGCYGAYLKYHIPVSQDLQKLPFQLEIKEIIKLFKKRHYKILEESGNYLDDGFVYQRTENQRIIFDADLRLLENDTV